MDPVLDDLEAAAGVLEPSAPTVALISNVTGDVVGERAVLDAAYWRRHARGAVRFADGVASLCAQDVDVVLELGPHAVLGPLASLAWPQDSERAVPAVVASLVRGGAAGAAYASALAGLYAAGADLDFAALHGGEVRRRVEAPGYPFQRERYWIEPARRDARAPQSGVVRLLEDDETSVLEELGLGDLNGQASRVLTALKARHAVEQAEAAVKDLSYAVTWRPAPVETSPSSIAGRWLILEDEGALGQDLGKAIARRGGTVETLGLADGPAGLEAWLDAADAPDVEAGGPAHVVLICPVGSETADAGAAAVAQLTRALALIQCLVSRESAARLSFVTRGAHAVNGDAEPVSPGQTALWGLARVLGLEHPGVLGKLIDLPVEAAAEAGLAEALTGALALDDAEDQLALRPARRSAGRTVERYVPRLERRVPQADAGPTLRGDGSYLITGGLGALGLEAAEWLARSGAGHVVLAGRRPPDDALRARLAELEAQTGCVIATARLDVSDGAAVTALVDRFAPAKQMAGASGGDTVERKPEAATAQTPWPPLAGVIHAAGVEGLERLEDLTPAALEKVVEAKVRGAWHLHRATRDRELSLFVGVSSIASVWGSQGQAHYAAANGFLDGLAGHRRSADLAGSVVNFGPWLGGGLADGETLAWLERAGVLPLSPAEGVAGLAVALGGPRQTVVARLDWPRFTSMMEVRRPRPLFEYLRPMVTETGAGTATALLMRLRRTPASERGAVLVGLVQDEVRSVLGLAERPPASVGFFDLGMDSLMAVELRSRLERLVGLGLPATLAMDYPNAGDLAAYLLARLFGEGDGEGVGPVQPEVPVTADEPIAIVGLACRFPGADDAASFWRLLDEGGEGIVEIPPSRFDLAAHYDPDPDAAGKIYTRRAGLIDGIELFDPGYFAISPREALAMDPQQRLLLEVSVEALEAAGIALNGLRRSRTGVYVGVGPNEYVPLLGRSDDPQSIDGHSATGASLSVIAGRVAFSLGLEGPAMALDTACSSSLVALHQAVAGLQRGEADLALAGGVNTVLSAAGMVATCRARMLSADGRCKTFDAAADGYVRGEGCGVVVLKRLSAAERDGDRIHAVIRGSAVNQDGASAGLTVPNGPAQERVIAAALARAGLRPVDIDYLECHGTGTELGDPIEVRAAASAYGEGRDPERPLLLGSVKTNIGHLEAAAGIAGLIKAVLALEHGVIPKHLNLITPSPHIDWDGLPVRVTTQATPLPPPGDRPARAGVSSFGFSGTNAHVVLEGYGPSGELPARAVPVAWPSVLESEALEAPAPEALGPRSHRLLPLSAKSAAALPQLAKGYLGWLEANAAADAQALADLAYTASVGRSHFGERAGLVFADGDGLKAGLEALASGASIAGLLTGSRASGSGAARVAFLFTGQGSQWVGMGRDLYESEPVFRSVLERCDAVIAELRGVSLLEVMFGGRDAGGDEPGDVPGDLPGDLNDTAWTQPSLYALGAGLTALWRSVGVEPCVVLGHSVGELAAAHAAGVLSLEDGLRLAAVRGSVMGALPTKGACAGAMAAVFAEAGRVAAAVEAVNGAAEGIGLSVAADNGSHRVVSGPAGLVARLADRLAAQGVRVERLATSHGFHSALMDPVLDDLEAAAGVLEPSAPTVALISNVTGDVVGESAVLDAAYWRRHARGAVRFADGIAALCAQDVDVVLELGPHAVLGPLASLAWPQDVDQSAPTMIPSLVRGGAAGASYASALAGLYAAGAALDFGALHGGEARRKLSLPGYPFQRERYWIEPARRRPADGHPLLGRAIEVAGTDQRIYQQRVSLEEQPWIDDHRVYGAAVIPGVSYIAMAIHTAATPCRIADVDFLEPMILPELPRDEEQHGDGELARELQFVSHAATAQAATRFEVLSREAPSGAWRRHAAGEIREGATLAPLRVDLAALEQVTKSFALSELEAMWARVSVAYGERLAAVTGARVGPGQSLAAIEVPPALAQDLAGEPIHPVLLDACTRLIPDVSALSALMARDEEAGTFWAPWQVGAVTLLHPVPGRFLAYVDAPSRLGADGQTLSYDIHLLDETGERFGLIEGFTLRRAPREAFLRALASERVEELLYEVVWRDVTPAMDEAAGDEAASGPVLLVDGGGGSAPVLAAIAAGLTSRGVSVVTGADKDPAPASSPAAVPGLGTPGLGGIVYVAVAGAAEEDETDPAEASSRRLGWLLGLLQEAVSAELSPPLGLTVVTAGGVAAVPGEAVDPAAAGLWGFVRSVQSEQPGLGLRLVDIEPGAAIGEELLALLAGAGPEPQLALRGGQLMAPRLGRTSGLAEASLTLRPEASYLITGGLGALGLEAAEWLARSGAGHLVLAGRQAPDAALRARLTELETETGCVIATARVDVSDGDAVAALVDRFAPAKQMAGASRRDTVERKPEAATAQTPWPPLAGVIHAAGVLDDGVVTAQTAERLACVLEPKARGAWHLHRASLDRDLDLFVLYSSAAATLGSAGQSNYAAANGFVDGLAAHRQSLGLAATSVAWGPVVFGHDRGCRDQGEHGASGSSAIVGGSGA